MHILQERLAEFDTAADRRPFQTRRGGSIKLQQLARQFPGELLRRPGLEFEESVTRDSRLKSRLRPMRELTRLGSARTIAAGHAFVQTSDGATTRRCRTTAPTPSPRCIRATRVLLWLQRPSTIQERLNPLNATDIPGFSMSSCRRVVVGPGGGLVVVGAGFQAAVQDADESVGQLA